VKYTEFRDQVRSALRGRKRGLTWAELRERLDLPYDRPCPNWTRRLEQEIGLTRRPGNGRAHVWTIGAARANA
jgi:hypothetical protein